MWMILALACALSIASSDALAKVAMRRIPSRHVAFARFACSAPFVAPLLFLGSAPSDPALFYGLVALATPVEIAAILLYMRAIHLSPLSLTLPFMAFTPAFILVTGRLILGEAPGPAGMLGVLLITCGAYALSARSGDRGLLAPIRSFAREPGSKRMLVVAAIYSVTAVLGKRMIQISSPLFTAGFYCVFTTLALWFVLSLDGGPRRLLYVFREKILWAVGLTQAGMVITHVIAINMVPAAYMMAVKRTSLLFGVFYGVTLFHEGMAGLRIAASIVMLAGVFVLALAT
ncbi:MAG: DMT family transporter [Thermodesulfobacteriota bacterium]